MTDATREQPLIAIDVVPTSFAAGSGLRVATARRAFAPYAGREALPGVLLQAAERLDDGARRALRTKTGIDAAALRHLAQVGAFDGPERDPRDAAISIAYVAVVADGDGFTASWTPVEPPAGAPSGTPAALPPGLPFDHDRIVTAALGQLRTLLWTDAPLTRALLGETFTTTDAARLQTALTGAVPDPGNLNRALRTNPALVRAEPNTSPAAALRSASVDASPSASTLSARGGRPPAVWTWRGTLGA